MKLTYHSGNAVTALALALALGGCAQLLGLEDIDQDGPPDAATESMALTIPVNATRDDAKEAEDGEVYVSSTDLEIGFRPVVGLRFLNVEIPAGATIVRAHVQFTAYAPDQNVPAAVNVFGEDNAQPAEFDGMSFDDLSMRPRTESVMEWMIPHWTASGQAMEEQRTPDLAVLIQEIIEHAQWQSGNPLVLYFARKGELVSDARRYATSFDGNSDNAPVLHITYRI